MVAGVVYDIEIHGGRYVNELNNCELILGGLFRLHKFYNSAVGFHACIASYVPQTQLPSHHSLNLDLGHNGKLFLSSSFEPIRTTTEHLI